MRKLGFIPFILACTITAALRRGLSRPRGSLHRAQAAGSATDMSRASRRRAEPGTGPAVSSSTTAAVARHHRARLVAKSPPDGYTIAWGPIGALAITRHMVAKLPYDIDSATSSRSPCGARASDAGGVAAIAGQFGAGADRLRQKESRQTFECIVEQRLARPCRRRAVQIHDRHGDRAHSLIAAARWRFNDLIARPCRL